MKQIMKKCETCNGQGVVKIDTLRNIHLITTEKVWCEEAEQYLETETAICPDCEGLGEIDITDDVEDDIAYMQRKERQNEN